VPSDVHVRIFYRLALTAPRVVDAGLGVTATLFAIVLTWVCNRAAAEKPPTQSS